MTLKQHLGLLTCFSSLSICRSSTSLSLISVFLLVSLALHAARPSLSSRLDLTHSLCDFYVKWSELLNASRNVYLLRLRSRLQRLACVGASSVSDAIKGNTIKKGSTSDTESDQEPQLFIGHQRWIICETGHQAATECMRLSTVRLPAVTPAVVLRACVQ